jgi:phenylacetate-CoA ligase
MAIWAMLKTQWNYSRGRRAEIEDLERIIRYMRQRRARGLDPLPLGMANRLRGRRRKRRDPAQLRALQARRVRNTVAYVYRYLPFYRQALDAAGVQPSDIRSLADVPKLPITRREQLAERGPEFVSRYPGLVPSTRVGSGGTTGRPLIVYMATEELQYYVANRAMSMLTSGWLGPSDILQMHQTLDGSAMGLITATAARMAGALVITMGIMGTLDDHLKSIFEERHIPGKQPKVSGLITSPSHLWALTHRAREKGLDLHDSGVRWIITGGATVSEDLKQRVLDSWGIRLSENYGLNEVMTAGGTPCHESDRLHFSDTGGYAEVLHPETEEPVPPGEPGVLVITTFYPNRLLTPLLRYWTEDLVTLSPDPVCVCGAVTTQILDVIGRADYMVTVGANNYYPQTIGDPLAVLPQLVQPPRFTLRTEMGEDAQYAILDVEVEASLSEEEQQELRKRIEQSIVLSRHWEVKVGSIRLLVNLCPAGSIEHPFPYKHRAT